MQLDEFRKGGFSGSSENSMSGSGESEVTKTSEFINRINSGERFISHDSRIKPKSLRIDNKLNR